VGLAPDDAELRRFFGQNGIQTVGLEDSQARVLVLSASMWPKLLQSPRLLRTLQNAVDRGQSVVSLDVGPRDLGQGYKQGDLGPLEGAPRVTNPLMEHYKLFSGIQLTFRKMAEPESNLQPALNDDSLWACLPRESTWLWNGLRGGLVVPSTDMDVSGLSRSAFLLLWASRGADAAAIQNNKDYYAYELAGYYSFSSKDNDEAVVGRLRDKVQTLFEDAPSLQDRINPNAPIVTTDLAQIYQQDGTEGKATTLTPLATCGKNLTRIPVVELGFGPARGKVILSQVLTAGRLVRGCEEPGLYGTEATR
jgi:beta-galactosidase